MNSSNRKTRTLQIRSYRWIAPLLALLLLISFSPAPVPVLFPVIPIARADEPVFAVPRTFDNETNWTNSVVVGDMDGDGDLDLVVGNASVRGGEGGIGSLQQMQNAVYLNDGLSNFYTGAVNCESPPVNVRCFGAEDHDTRSVAVGDMNSDGHLDVISGNYNQQNYVYLNDGKGNFNWNGTTRPIGSEDFTVSVAVGDLNADGHLDIVVGNCCGDDKNTVAFNDRQGNFNILTNIRSFGRTRGNETTSLAIGDMNNDRYLDIVVVTDQSQNAIYLNKPGRPGDFVLYNPSEADTSIDDFSCADVQNIYCFGSRNASTQSVAVADLNRDDLLDIVVGNISVVGKDAQNEFYINSSSSPGNFSSGQAFGESPSLTNSVAVGDVNNDGFLDLVAGRGGFFGESNAVYLSSGGSAPSFTTEILFAIGPVATASVTAGDMDGDGDLDLITGNGNDVEGQQNNIYLNNGGGDFSIRQRFGSLEDYTDVTAVGDLDGDGDLDVVVGNSSSMPEPRTNQDAIYLSDLSDSGGRIPPSFTERRFGALLDFTRAIAVGDIDGDNDLDIVTGNVAMKDPSTGDWIGGQNIIYINNGQNPPTFASRPFGTGEDRTTSVALGDIDADGDLDIVAGNVGGQDNTTNPTGEQNVIYINNGAGQYHTGQVVCGVTVNVRCFGTGKDQTRSVALGDVDSDNDLDIAVGNGDITGQQNRVYLNDGRGNFGWRGSERPFGTGTDQTASIAVADIDNDGNLDLVTGNGRAYGQGDAVYLNDGTGTFKLESKIPFGTGGDDTSQVATGDLDGDGDLDIVSSSGKTAAESPENTVYFNGGVGNFISGRTFRDSSAESGLALGDIDRDGDLDVILGNQIFMNSQSGINWQGGVILPNNPPTVFVSRPGATPEANFFSTPVRLSDQYIPITYTVSDSESEPVDVRAYYSLNGGNSWRPAAARAGIPTRLATSPGGISYTFEWDTFASELFGRSDNIVFGYSDNVVFRIEAYTIPFSTTISSPGTFRYISAVPGPFQRPYASATTFPFRVRGTQVRVLREDGTPPPSAAAPAAPSGDFRVWLPVLGQSSDRLAPVTQGALVYRWSDGQAQAEPIARDPQNAYATAYRTDGQGYLQGRGTLAEGDNLVALQPIAATRAYTLYHTSARAGPTGIEPAKVERLGVQTLTVSPNYPLILFNLVVSLEWDASRDEQYLRQLEENFQRTSAVLYDWSDGQMALGDVTIYHDREQWDDADVRIHASNRLRPYANQGGIVGADTPDPDRPGLLYKPGRVHMGATWNRYGEPEGNLGEDWPRALAHELGHFALFLNENYIGQDTNGVIIPVSTCPSGMSDPYLDRQSEFHPAAGWRAAGGSRNCEDTLSHQSTGRSDWETIKRFYDHPELNFRLNTPGGFSENAGPSNQVLALTNVRIVPPTGPAPLATPIIYLSDSAGRPVIPGSGARAVLFQADRGLGRRVIDLGRPVAEQVEARGARAGDELCVYDLENRVVGCDDLAENSQQLALTRLNAPWQPELAINPRSPTEIELSVAATPPGQTVQAQLFPVEEPATVVITLSEVAPGRYSGAFPTLEDAALEGYVRVWFDQGGQHYETVSDYAIGGNPGKSRKRRRGAVIRRRAPVLSADGQAIVFARDELPEGEFYTLQSTQISSPPGWATPVGQAYRLTATEGAPTLRSGASLSISYFSADVVPGEEPWIRMYFFEDGQRDPAARCGIRPAPCWRQLPTVLNPENNSAAAPTQGPGQYALMTSVELPLGAGWNQIAYPVETRPVREALASIKGLYTTVYGFDPSDPEEPWLIYDVSLSDELNTLRELEFNHGYLIYVRQDVTLQLRGPLNNGLQAQVTSDMVPPATFYGEVENAAGAGLAAGMPVVARIDGVICGQGSLVAVGERLHYLVHVAAEGPGAAGCGMPGRTVNLQLGARNLVGSLPWDNTRVTAMSPVP